MKLVVILATLLCWVAVLASENDKPDRGPTTIGQSAADALKSFASAQGALLPAGLIGKPISKDDLSTILDYPKDEVVVLSLTGSQLKEAFERSLLLFPEPNVGFLQVSGFEITFDKNGQANSKVTLVTVEGSKLEDTRKYDVAMPSSLQRGQLGYSHLWDKAKVVRTFPHSSMLDVLKGKHPSSSSPRWLPQG
ncbi:MAG TPA: 5'-nucleotidase [Fimbriimonas sp.]|nr:5'-nucleotidase [Fimbriimonas sp.]